MKEEQPEIKLKSVSEMVDIETEILSLEINSLKIKNRVLSEQLGKIEQLEQELQKTREQLEKAQGFISDFKDIFEQEKDDTILSELDDLWFNYNRNFKDKQGE